MTEWSIAGLAIAAILSLIGKIVFDWLGGSRKKNGSGEQPVDFWRMEFRAAIREELEQSRRLMNGEVEKLRKICEDNNSLLHKLLESGRRR